MRPAFGCFVFLHASLDNAFARGLFRVRDFAGRGLAPKFEITFLAGPAALCLWVVSYRRWKAFLPFAAFACMTMEAPAVTQTPEGRSRPSVRRVIRPIESLLARAARRRVLSCLAVGLLALGLRVVLLPVLPKPTPEYHDEFSYLLAGETFAQGRLTNPSHPMWKFFETLHVNMKPTYASKYPPGQGAFLALGIRLFGHPWFGVWLSMGFLCGCICWMLQGWVLPKFALIGGVLAALQLSVTGYWINSYWGGAVAAMGGSLVLGAVPRLARRGNVATAATGAIGIGILANSRPFEGAVMVILSMLTLMWWTHRLGRLATLWKPRLIATVVAELIVVAGAMAYYNWRVTGNPVTLPYVVYEKQYGWPPVLWLLPLSPAPATFRDFAMKQMWEWDQYQYLRTRHNPLRLLNLMGEGIYATFISGAGFIVLFLLLIPLLLAHLLRIRMALILLVGFLVILMTEKLIYAHYLAPAAGLFFLLPMFGLQLIGVLSVRGRRIGRLLVGTIVFLSFVCFVASTVHRIGKGHTVGGLVAFRVATIQKLRAEPGRHLVFVRYGPDHYPHEEMVYNGPDIDRQQIVWAIDRGATENRQLLDYYPDRKAWLMQPDGPGRSVVPYQSR